MEPTDGGWGAEVAVEVSASPHSVWAIVSDISQHPTLAGSGEVLRVRVSGPLAVGMTFDSDVRTGEVGSFSPTSVIDDVDEPHRLGWICLPPLDPDETEAHQIGRQRKSWRSRVGTPTRSTSRWTAAAITG